MYPELTAAIQHRASAEAKLAQLQTAMAARRAGVDAEYARRCDAGMTEAQRKAAAEWYADALGALKAQVRVVRKCEVCVCVCGMACGCGWGGVCDTWARVSVTFKRPTFCASAHASYRARTYEHRS